MSLANVEVRTLGELEDAFHTIFEKALNQVHFCDSYVEVCEELETTCLRPHLARSTQWHGLTYLSLEEHPPTMVAGPFTSRPAANRASDLSLNEAPPDLVCEGRSRQDGKLLKIWTDEAKKNYYVSIPIVLRKPYKSRLATTLKRTYTLFELSSFSIINANWGCSTVQRMNKATAEKVKQRKLGTCYLLGALFRRGFVEASTLHRCIEVLLDARQNIAGDLDLLNPQASPNDMNLEVLCTLLELKSVGERLESQCKDRRQNITGC